MKKNIFLVLVGFGVIVTIVFSFIRNPVDLPKNNLWNKSPNIKESENPANDIETSPTMTKSVRSRDIVYTVNSVTRSKEKGPLDMLYDRYDHIKVDQNGTIINDKSYLILNISFQNDQEQSKIFSLGNNQIFSINERDEIEDSFEMTVFDRGQNGFSKDYRIVTLNAKETVTYNIGYVIDDEFLDAVSKKERLYYHINPGGLSLSENVEDQLLIKLDY